MAAGRPDDSPHHNGGAGGPVEPADLSSLAELRSVQLSEDGTLIAAVVVRLPQETNRVERRLVTGLVERGVVSEGAPPGAGVSEELPRWEPVSGEASSPRLAAVRSDGRTWRLVIRQVDVDGALREDSEVELARWDEPVTELCWSPDRRWLLAVIREQQDRARTELPEDRRPPLHLTRLRYRYDGLGYTLDRPHQAFLIPASGGPSRKLSRGGYDDSDFSWHPDGSAVVFVSQRHDRSDRTLLNDIYVQSLDDSDPRQITRTEYHYAQPRFSPDGTKLAATVVDVSHFPSTSDLVVLHPGDGKTLSHLENLDRDCNGPTTDSEGLIWADNGTILALVEDEGRIYALATATNQAGSTERIVDGDRWVTSLAASSDGTFAYVTSSPTDPDALVIRRDGKEDAIFAPNDRFRESHDLRQPVHEIIETAPGVQIDSWLMLPDAGRWRAPYPLLVSMQGGGSQYGYHWSHESQTLCAAGFAVLYMNARGSAGYGKAWYRAVCGPNAASPASGWGEDDISDMLAVVDATLERSKDIDPERVGVLGGSYGALCVTWMLERSDLFRAGWAERGPYNLYSLAGTNDESPWFFTQYLGRTQVEDPAAYWTSSPLRRVAEITAPLMIVHSENDLRCPIQQAEELFMALKMLDRPVEFIRFPGEGHSLTRTGSPAHRLQRLELLVEWFTRWLKPQSVEASVAQEVDAAGVTG